MAFKKFINLIHKIYLHFLINKTIKQWISLKLINKLLNIDCKQVKKNQISNAHE
jgi:hypothetical protein